MLGTETIISLVIGLLGGSGVTWFVARHFYLRADRERPKWADDALQDVLDRYVAKHPSEDPGDLVAIFDAVLEERGVLKRGDVIDGGFF